MCSSINNIFKINWLFWLYDIYVYLQIDFTAALLDSLYDSYKDEDGFLYMCYSSEKTFGWVNQTWNGAAT